MRVNANRVRELREGRSWTQEELALAAGLNLRTVQRIENEATASVQSKKALASALDVDSSDLDHDAAALLRRFEYKTVEIEPKEGFLAGIRRPDLPDFAQLLNAEGQQGWTLVQILTPDLAQRLWAGRTGRFVALMQRELPPTDGEGRNARTRR